jgi:hypothetical protein
LPPLIYYVCFSEAKLCLRKFILLLFFRQCTPLHLSASFGHLEVTQFLVASNADVGARSWCFSPPPSHHLSLTICLAAMAKLHSNAPSTATKPTSLHTSAASARLNDAPPRLLRPNNCNYSKIYCCSSPRRCCLSDGIMQVTQLRTWHNSSRTTTATATKCTPAT